MYRSDISAKKGRLGQFSAGANHWIISADHKATWFMAARDLVLIFLNPASMIYTCAEQMTQGVKRYQADWYCKPGINVHKIQRQWRIRPCVFMNSRALLGTELILCSTLPSAGNCSVSSLLLLITPKESEFVSPFFSLPTNCLLTLLSTERYFTKEPSKPSLTCNVPNPAKSRAFASPM